MSEGSDTIIVNCTTTKRKVYFYRLDSDSRTDSSGSPFERERKRTNLLRSDSENRRSVAASRTEREGRSEKVCTASRQPGAALTPETVNRTTTKRKKSAHCLDSGSRTDSSGSPFEPERKRRNFLHNDRERNSSVAGCLWHKPDERLQRNDGRDYGTSSRQPGSAPTFGTSSRQPVSSPTTEVTGGSSEGVGTSRRPGASPIFGTSSRRPRDSPTSGTSFRQPVATATSEVTEGSSEGNDTSSIRPGAAPTAEVTGTVSPSTASDGYNLRGVAFCVNCLESDWEDRMLTCPGCNLTYHFVCLNLNTIPLGEWFCPMCIWTNIILDAG
jgi:hypothetical protein